MQTGPTVENAERIRKAEALNRATTGPTVGRSYSDEPWRKKQAADIKRQQAQQNSQLAGTMALFTPSGFNTGAGVTGAETFVNMNPLITGPVMSTHRLYGAGRSMFDPNTFNPYFGSDKGVLGNILGGLNLAGDIGMLRMTLRNPSGNLNPESNPWWKGNKPAEVPKSANSSIENIPLENIPDEVGGYTESAPEMTAEEYRKALENNPVFIKYTRAEPPDNATRLITRAQFGDPMERSAFQSGNSQYKLEDYFPDLNSPETQEYFRKTGMNVFDLSDIDKLDPTKNILIDLRHFGPGAGGFDRNGYLINKALENQFRAKDAWRMGISGNKYGGDVYANGGTVKNLLKAKTGLNVNGPTKCGPNQIYLEGVGCIDTGSKMYQDLYNAGKLGQKDANGNLVTWLPEVTVNSKLTAEQKDALARKEMQERAFQNQTAIGPEVEQPLYKRAWDLATHPFTAIRSYNKTGYVPSNLGAVAAQDENPIHGLNFISPAVWAKGLYGAGKQLLTHPVQTPIDVVQGAGNLLGWGLNKIDAPLPGQTKPEYASPFGDAGTNTRALEFLKNVGEAAPFLEVAPLLKGLQNPITQSIESGLLSNVHRINPLAGTFAGESKLPSWLQLNKLDDPNAFWRLTRDPIEKGIYEGSYFNKGVPLTGDLANTFEKGSRPWMHRYSGLIYNPETGQMNRYFGPDHLFKVTDPSKMEPFLKFPEPHLKFFRSTEAMTPSSPGVTQFKKDWLQGWKQVSKPASISSSVDNVGNTFSTKPYAFNQTKFDEAKGFLDRYQHLKKLQNEGLIAKDADVYKYARSGQGVDDITRRAIEHANTRYRGVYPNLKAYGQTGENYGTGARVTDESMKETIDAMKTAGVDITNESAVGEYMASHVPLNRFGYRSGIQYGYDTPQGWDALFTSDRPGGYGSHVYQLRRPFNFEQGNYKDWMGRFNLMQNEPKAGELVRGFENQREKLNEILSTFTPGRIHNTPYNFIGPRGHKVLDVVREVPKEEIQTFKNILPKKEGGVIKDNMGYWNPDNWGKVVEIDSPDITMQGVNQPLLGISDEGDVQYMEPGKDYKFKGKKVVEYPMFQNGGLTKYQTAGSVRTTGQAWGDLFNKVLPFLSPIPWVASKLLPNDKKNVKSTPVQTAPVQQPEFINIKDPRKIRMTTGQPMVPTRDLVGAEYPLVGIKSLLERAKERGVSKEDAWNLATIAFQESKWGKTDENLGHTLHGNENLSAEENLINAYLGKMKEAEGYGIQDPLKKLQIYNGSWVKPETEKGYHGFVAKAFYGVPVPKGGIDLRKNPLYGKQITDLRENVLKQNPEFVNIFNSYFKAYGGPLVDYYAGKMNHGEMFKDGGSVREKTIYPSGTRQPLSLNAVMSQNRMDRDNNSYSGGISKFAEGGSLLSRTVTCSNCGWSWKGVDGGSDPMTCHKCGGDIKMKQGGQANRFYYNKGYGVPQFYGGGGYQAPQTQTPTWSQMTIGNPNATFQQPAVNTNPPKNDFFSQQTPVKESRDDKASIFGSIAGAAVVTGGMIKSIDNAFRKKPDNDPCGEGTIWDEKTKKCLPKSQTEKKPEEQVVQQQQDNFQLGKSVGQAMNNDQGLAWNYNPNIQATQIQNPTVAPSYGPSLNTNVNNAFSTARYGGNIYLPKAQTGRGVKNMYQEMEDLANTKQKCGLSDDDKQATKEARAFAKLPDAIPIAEWDEISNIENLGLDKKGRKALEKEYEAAKANYPGLDLSTYVAATRDASRTSTQFANTDRYSKYFDPKTGALLPNVDNRSIDPFMRFYRGKFPTQSRISPTDVLNTFSNMPGGLSNYSKYANVGYVPPIQRYGGDIFRSESKSRKYSKFAEGGLTKYQTKGEVQPYNELDENDRMYKMVNEIATGSQKIPWDLTDFKKSSSKVFKKPSIKQTSSKKEIEVKPVITEDPYHPLTNPSGYRDKNVLDRLKKLPNKEERYEPSQLVNDVKAGLSAWDIATSSGTQPWVQAANWLARAANSTGDGYTALRYAMDGQWGQAGIDAAEAILDAIPYAKKQVIFDKNVDVPKGKLQFTKLGKARNALLKAAKAGAQGDDFMHSSIGRFLFGDPDSQVKYNNGGDISIPQLPTKNSPLLQFYYNNI
jgi:hypothetical protein